MKTTTLAAFMLIAATPALADAGWDHSFTPGFGGQYEAGYLVDGDRYGIDYSCSLMNGIFVYARGVKAVPGNIHLLVDGVEVIQAKADYQDGMVSMSWDVDPVNAGLATSQGFNQVIDGLAKGNQATIVTPDGSQFPVSLKGSSDISACRVR